MSSLFILFFPQGEVLFKLEFVGVVEDFILNLGLSMHKIFPLGSLHPLSFTRIDEDIQSSVAYS